MAKGSYTRRSTQGGRFRRYDFGDLGLRSYADQQKQIIDSIKIQRARAKEISSEYAQSMGDVAANEQRNRTILQDLENEAYETRRKAMDVRAQREIEALEGKAKEYGKEKERWQNFSKTEAAKWGMLAKGTLATVDKIRAEMDWPDMKKQLELISDKYSVANQGVTENISKDIEKNFPKNPDISRNLLQILTGSGTHLSNKFRAWYEVNSHVTPAIAQHLARQHGEEYHKNPSHWNEMAFNVLADKAGIKKGTPGYQKALKRLYATNAVQEKQTSQELAVKETAELIKKEVDAINELDKTSPTYNQDLQPLMRNLMNIAAHGSWKDGDKYVKGNGNKGLAGYLMTEALLQSNKYSTGAEIFELYKNFDTDGKGTNYHKRHFENHGEDWERGIERYTTRKDKERKRERQGTALKLGADFTSLGELKEEAFQEGAEGEKSQALEEFGFPHSSFNLTNPELPNYKETRLWVFNQIKRSNLETKDRDSLMRTHIKWDSSNTIPIDKYSELQSAAVAKNWELYNYLFAGLTKKEQGEVRIQNLNVDVSGMQNYSQDFKTKANNIRMSFEKGNKSLTGQPITNKDAGAQIDRYAEVRLKQIFMNQDEGTRKLPIDQRITAAGEQLTMEIRNAATSKQGVFANSEGTGGQATVWHSVVADTSDALPLVPQEGKKPEDSILYLANPAGSGPMQVEQKPEEALKEFLNKPKIKGKVVSRDVLDDASRKAFLGQTIKANDTVSFLADRFNTTESTVWKMLGIKANPSMKDQILKYEPSNNSKAYTQFVKGVHAIENKLAIANAWRAADMTGLFPTTSWTKLQIDTYEKGVFEKPLTDLTDSMMYITSSINPDVRVDYFKQLSLEHFNITSDLGFSGTEWIKNMRTTGGWYNAFTNESLWEKHGAPIKSLNRNWNVERADEIPMEFEGGEK